MVLLRKLRTEKGLSINGLAKATGADRFVISNIENKQYKTSNENMKKLADYFGIKEPLDLTINVTEVIQNKNCLNQRCQLNKECYCQSDQVCAGASCASQYKVSNPVKQVSTMNTLDRLFTEI